MALSPKLRALICIGLLSLAGSVCAKQVRVGVYDNEPKIFTDSVGIPSGIMIDVLKEIAEKEGWQLSYVPCEWEDCLNKLEAGHIDLMPDVAYSAERDRRFDFHATPALYSWSQIYRHNDVEISSVLDLKGKRIALLGGGIQEEALTAMLAGFGIKAQLIRTATLDEAFRLAQSGQADAAVSGHQYGDFHKPDYRLIETSIIFQPSRLFFVTAQGRRPDLLNGIEKYLSVWHNDPGSPYFEIIKRWGGHVPAPLIPSAVWNALLVVTGLMLMSLLGAVILRRQVKIKTRQLSESNSQLLATLDAIPDLLLEVGLDGRVYGCHSPRHDLLAAPAEAFIGKNINDAIPGAAAEICMSAIREANEVGWSSGKEYELSLPHCELWFELSTSRKQTEPQQEPRFIILSRDITQRKASEAKILRLTKLYAELSQCNRAIVRCTDEAELFKLICRDAVDFGGMKMAWIGMVDEQSKLVKPVAAFGSGTEYLDSLHISIDGNDPAGRGPTGMALRENRPFWCQDFANDPATAPWHERGARFGWGASASIPLRCRNVVVGTLTLYTGEANAFDEPGRNLLVEMATDISYALNHFATDAERKKMENSLRESEERLELALHAANQGIYDLNIRTGEAVVSQEYATMLGYDPADFHETHTAWAERLHPDDRARATQIFLDYLAGKIPEYRVEFRQKTRSGEWKWILSLGSVVERDIEGRPLRMLGTHTDITARKQSEDALIRLSMAVEQSSNSIVITDLDARIEYVNSNFTRMTGYTPDEVMGRNPNIVRSGKTPNATYVDMWAHLTRGKSWQGELINRRKDGTEYIEAVQISPVRQADGRVTNYLAIKEDITGKKASEERIEKLAHFDQLTGLPNRSLLNDRFKYAISLAQRSGEQLTVMFLDLDHFKIINDNLGHTIGDQLLMEVSKRIKATLREEDTVSRQGGDEFILILPGTDADGAALVATKLIEAISRPCQIEQNELVTTTSIGITIYPHDGKDLETLSKNADTAMYRVKQNNRNDFCFFMPEMQAHSARIMQLSNALRHALARNELQLHYQPQVLIQNGRVVGAEALLRWQHPELGSISPVEFIKIAEDSGKIIAIGEWVLRTAAKQLRGWLDSGLPPMVMAVNLSAVQFRQPNLPELVTRILDEANLPYEYLELELTEAAAMNDPLTAVTVMDKLHELGIRMAIDDFGTGYSSLSYLKRFKVHKLKIDQSFVRDITDDPDDKAIVTAIINMASSLGMQTIAEGVENAGQLAFLRLQGCAEAQGYYFSKPLPADQFEAFVKNQGNGHDPLRVKS